MYDGHLLHGCIQTVLRQLSANPKPTTDAISLENPRHAHNIPDYHPHPTTELVVYLDELVRLNENCRHYVV